ncbi:alveolar macrophage chemotactic factor 2-like [Lampris incognitus]|uniref:alveolar macrophage chemotactic factor 2-like n=1 Tax=Lampris incognitus TaxID=2546036 RepID=UPI0024B5EA75|nr:alveolar macrophage chemotactic factor 2-like [Lampris incognitus]
MRLRAQSVVSAPLGSGMKLDLQTVCQLSTLSLCSLLIAVSDSTHVPGRCMCPGTQVGVRGQLKTLRVFVKGPNCGRDTVIVTLKNGEAVCLNPDRPMGKQLIRCWKRATKLGRDVSRCLTRRQGQRHQRVAQRSGAGTRAQTPPSPTDGEEREHHCRARSTRIPVSPTPPGTPDEKPSEGTAGKEVLFTQPITRPIG